MNDKFIISIFVFITPKTKNKMIAAVRFLIVFLSFSAFAQPNFSKSKVVETKLSSKYQETPTSYRDGYLYYYKAVDEDVTNKANYHIYRVKVEDAKLKGKSEQIDDKLNTRYSEGQIAFDEEKKLVYVTRNMYTEEELKTKNISNNPLEVIIYEESGEEYIFKERFAFNDSNASVGYPCFSELTHRLYFSSKKETGKGGYDLYYCELKEGSEFSELKPLGDNINGRGDEFYPSVKQGVLYFASFNSDKYRSDLDIYYVTEIGIDKGEKPKVLPSPINSEGDDFAITFIDGKSGFLSSNRASYPVKNSDIYYFDLGEPIINEDEFNLLLAIEKEKKDKLTLSNFKVVDKKTNIELAKVIVADGIIVENVKEGTVYEISFDEELQFENFEIGPYTKLVKEDVFKEEKIEVKEVIKIEKEKIDQIKKTQGIGEGSLKEMALQFIQNAELNLYFDFGKSTLTDIAKNELNTLYKKMEEHKVLSGPGLVIYIEGQTDTVGTKTVNQKLSVERAKSVENYLKSLGDFQHPIFDVKGIGSSSASNRVSNTKNRKVVVTLGVAIIEMD